MEARQLRDEKPHAGSPLVLCKKAIIGFATLLCAVASWAEEITLQQAERAVGNWIAGGGGFGKLAGGGSVSGKTLEDPDTGAKMHVVRVPGKGFVVTSADDGIEPVILFSEGGGDEFVAEAGCPVWDLLRWDIAARTAALAEEKERNGSGRLRLRSAGVSDGGSQTKSSPKEQWAALLPAKGDRESNAVGLPENKVWSVRRRPLLTTRWYQTEGTYGGIYNMYTPGKREVTTVPNAASSIPKGWVGDAVVTNELGHYPVGCVAVAGGQLMKFWKYPKSAVAEKDAVCHVDGEERTLHFYGTQVVGGTRLSSGYNWDSMGVAEPATGIASEYVSRLLSDIGVTCRASYAAGGTAMSLYMLTSELKSTFRYGNAVYHTGNLSGAGLREVVIPNLDAGCPVLMGIGSAHAVVVDGYGFDRDETAFYMHVNLGWGYDSYLWYSPPNIDKYSTIDEIVCNVFPEASGQLVSGRVVGPHGRAIYNMSVVYDGATAGSVNTGADGIYHARVSTGSYRIWAQDAYAASTTPIEFTVEGMSTTVNGNRIIDITHSNAATVGDIAMAVSSAVPNGSGTQISSPTSVSLSCATAGAEIRYTLDGTMPDPESALYEGPITIQDSTTLRAIAFANGMECSGMFEKEWNFVDSVSRDNFANARPLSGTSGHSSFDNTGYTKEAGEPVHSDKGTAGGTSAWAAWTAPESGDWTFSLSGTITSLDEPMDTQLAVYTGSAVDALTRIAANDNVNADADNYSSRVSFAAVKGVTYHIAMDSYNGANYPGSLTLEWKEGFTHYALFEYGTMFAPVSGGEAKIKVLSSARWNVVECSDWIVPGAFSGTNGVDLALSIAPNSTGVERTGYLTIQAGNSELTSLAVRQHTIDFVTTKEHAVEEAWRTNKRILLLYGREGCYNTRTTLFSSIPSSSVWSLIENGYVLWYSNCDRQSGESYMYSAGGYLPTVAILDPLDMTASVAAVSGLQSASALTSFLESNATWSGLPAPTHVVLSGADAVLSETPYSMDVTFADDTVVSMKHGVTWTLASGTAATLSDRGVLTPVAGQTGSVSVRGSVVLRGKTYTQTMGVRVVSMSLNDILNNSALSFETGGAAPWGGTLSDSHDGVAAARSGLVSHGQSSWLQAKVIGPGTLSFWWNASSESASYDYLSFSIDGAEQARIGGTDAGWTQKSFSIGAGTHVIRWEYSKDESVSSGSDCGWVDQISWTGQAVTPSIVTFYGGGKTLGTATMETGKNTNQAAASAYKPTRAGYVLTRSEEHTSELQSR